MDEEGNALQAVLSEMRRSTSIERIPAIDLEVRGNPDCELTFQAVINSPRAARAETPRSGSSSPVLVEGAGTRWGSGKQQRK